MLTTFTASVRDGLSNLAASLGVGKDKASADAFFLRELSRPEIEAMYRGDWLARKVVDIVPADMCREWRQWSGERADVARVEAAERRLGLRRAVQRAMVLGRLTGGGAIVVGNGETDPAALARPLDPFDVPRGGLRFLHVVSRWQLGTPGLDRDPLSPWYGEAEFYEVVAPGRGALVLHPSRVVRFLGNPWPDPSVAATPWSDSVLQALYDAVHAVALTVAGATSLMHEAKVDVVTVPNLSEHLSSAETTNQLSARFGYAAAMKSINNLLLLGDGETWNRQRVDFAGLPEMVRTFLQVAAGAADIPVTRLLGQSPAGLSATGESDTRNYYDMIAGAQELELRPALERLDRIIAASEGIDPGALTFAFRPLWQLDAASAATIALQKAQATQVYAGLNLWPKATTARLVAAQLAEDGTYPNARTVFEEGGAAGVGDTRGVTDIPVAPLGSSSSGAGLPHYAFEPRDWHGRWTTGSVAVPANDPLIFVNGQDVERELKKELEESGVSSPDEAEKPSLLDPTPKLAPDGALRAPPFAFTSKPNPPKTPSGVVAPVKSSSSVASSASSSTTAKLTSESAGSSANPTSPINPSESSSSAKQGDTKASILQLFDLLAQGRIDEAEDLKAELPLSISKHLIPGIIGPGPFAQTSIPVSSSDDITDDMRDYNDAVGFSAGCHRCGSLDPGTTNGRYIVDHQFSTAINPPGWMQALYPHCLSCSRSQGGHIAAYLRAVRAIGWVP